MKLATTRFGELEIAEEFVYSFPEGLPGFEGKRYVLIQHPDNALVAWLQSAHDPAIALMLMDPMLLEPEYHYDPRPNDLSPIEKDSLDGVDCRVIVRRGERDGELFVNLVAPVLFNSARGKAMQLPLVGSPWSVREIWPKRSEP